MIRKGDIVHIKPEWQDVGDSKFIWLAVSDEEKGRVDISPDWPEWGPLSPVHTVRTDMLA